MHAVKYRAAADACTVEAILLMARKFNDFREIARKRSEILTNFDLHRVFSFTVILKHYVESEKLPTFLISTTSFWPLMGFCGFHLSRLCVPGDGIARNSELQYRQTYLIHCSAIKVQSSNKSQLNFASNRHSQARNETFHSQLTFHQTRHPDFLLHVLV